MTESTDCKKYITTTNFANETGMCETIVNERVCVQATVTVTPNVDSGPSTSFCLGNPVIGSCKGRLEPQCIFTVSQEICVEIPLTFSATATATENGLVCGGIDTQPCQDGNACTHTIGYFRNHSTITNELIANAGGSIILGMDDDGLSFTVTSSNANDVFDFKTPEPPTPTDPPFHQQYLNLYAQLLAANLNVLALQAAGFEVCSYALQAINEANQFLADSPDGGMANAPEYQTPLERFNSGTAPGCPTHCD
ncbi:MAG: hypothetical protein ACK5MV_04260 [Aminipila sp.]